MQAVRAHPASRPCLRLSKPRASGHIQKQHHHPSAAVLPPRRTAGIIEQHLTLHAISSSSYTSLLLASVAAPANPSVLPKPFRTNMQTCQAGWHLPSAVEDQLQKVQGPRAFFFCFMLGIVAWVLFTNLEAQIAAAVGEAFKNPSLMIDIRALDVQQRFYSPDSLAQTFAAWAPKGRAAFAAYEFVDLGIFFAAYSGILLCALNGIRPRLEQQQQQQQQQGDLVGTDGLVRLGYLLVIMLLVADLSENLLQLLLSDTFKLGPAAAAAGAAADVRGILSNCTQPLWWRAFAGVCAGVHVTKWLLIYANLAVIGAGTARVLLGETKTE